MDSASARKKSFKDCEGVNDGPGAGEGADDGPGVGADDGPGVDGADEGPGVDGTDEGLGVDGADDGQGVDGADDGPGEGAGADDGPGEGEGVDDVPGAVEGAGDDPEAGEDKRGLSRTTSWSLQGHIPVPENPDLIDDAVNDSVISCFNIPGKAFLPTGPQ